MRSIWRLVTLVPNYRGRLLSIATASTVSGFAWAATPLIYRDIVNTVADLSGHHISRAQGYHEIGIAILAVTTVRAVIVGANYILERHSDSLCMGMVSTLREVVFHRLTKLSLEFYERVRVGDVMERYSSIPTIAVWPYLVSQGTLSYILQLVFGVLVLLLMAPWVGALMLIVLPFNLALSVRQVSKANGLRREFNLLVGRMSGILNEMVSQIMTVRSFAGEAAVIQNFSKIQNQWRQPYSVEQTTRRTLGITVNVVNMVAITVSVSVVAVGALNGRYTPGDVLLVLTLTQMLFVAIQPISMVISSTGTADSLAERLVELLHTSPTVIDTPVTIDVPKLELVEFHNLSYTYPGRSVPCLRNVSFQLEKGTTLALVGPSGSGKSTLIKLLMRFYDPEDGGIFINGQNIRSFSQNQLRSQFGVVLQEVALFDDTIANNIRFACPMATDAQVISAAEAAYADAFIRRLPAGYNTFVGERGVRLSGGEKQRIAIARAFLRDPQLVILDEATSALDAESDVLVQRGLRRLMAGRSAIIIAHRLSTITEADNIVVMEDGCAAEIGNHSSLMKVPNGLYARLHALQAAGLDVTEKR